MSSVAFGALTTRREISASGTSKSAQPPGLNGYIDILSALVPAEVLAIHAIVLSIVVTSRSKGQAQITDVSTAKLAFWLLLALSAVLFVLGRGGSPTIAPGGRDAGERTVQPQWEWQDAVRLLIPPVAFVGWTMLEPVSTWNAVAPHVSAGMRVLIATVVAAALAALTKALTTHADKKAPLGGPGAGKKPQLLDGQQQPEVQAQPQAAELLRRAELSAAAASTAAATFTDRGAEATRQRPAIGHGS